MTKSTHFFNRKGRIVFGKPVGEPDEEAFEKLIDTCTIGADFVEDDKLEVYTEPSQMNAAAEAISHASGRSIQNREIIWDPKPETLVDITSSDTLTEFFSNSCSGLSLSSVALTARRSYSRRSMHAEHLHKRKTKEG